MPKLAIQLSKRSWVWTAKYSAQAIRQAKQGEVTFRVDSGRNIHAPIGKISFSDEQLIENLKSLMKTLSAKKPATSKGRYMKKSYFKTTMGPSFQVDIEGIDPKSKHYLLDIKE